MEGGVCPLVANEATRCVVVLCHRGMAYGSRRCRSDESPQYGNIQLLPGGSWGPVRRAVLRFAPEDAFMMVWNCKSTCRNGEPGNCKQFPKHDMQQYDGYCVIEER